MIDLIALVNAVFFDSALYPFLVTSFAFAKSQRNMNYNKLPLCDTRTQETRSTYFVLIVSITKLLQMY